MSARLALLLGLISLVLAGWGLAYVQAACGEASGR